MTHVEDSILFQSLGARIPPMIEMIDRGPSVLLLMIRIRFDFGLEASVGSSEGFALHSDECAVDDSKSSVLFCVSIVVHFL